MGKNSWLTAVKRAFRSPTKDSEKKSSRRKVDHPQPAELLPEKSTTTTTTDQQIKRRWLFKKHNSSNTLLTEPAANPPHKQTPEQRHAIAVAAATAAAAEAAVATAKAAVEIIRLTASNPTPYKMHSAATLIQAAFRGYLARRALIALKGIVKLQALIRGQNVRKQATLTMRCMQTLLRVQARMRDQRSRFSHDGGRRSMFAETSNIWESKYIRDIRDRHNSRSSRDGSSVTDDWRPPECPRTLEELEAILKARNEAAMMAHENSLAFAFSQQNKIQMDSDRYTTDESESENRAKWLDKRMSTTKHQQWETGSRTSTDYKRGDLVIKTVEIETVRTPSGRRSRCQSPAHRQPASPHNCPSTPRTRNKLPPRSREEESRSYSTANTPSLRSVQRVMSSVPNYMAATESAKARVRSQSAPRQRPGTPERERGSSAAKKRLSYPIIPEPYCVNFGFGCNGQNTTKDLRSPSFKSVQAGYVGMEERSSCYTESIAGGEISPCSTTDLRRWLR